MFLEITALQKSVDFIASLRVMLTELDYNDPAFFKRLGALCTRDGKIATSIEDTTRKIIHAVSTKGDQAVIHYTNQLDGLDVMTVNELVLTNNQIQVAAAEISNELQQALQAAANRIRLFHEKQLQQSWQYQESNGTILGQKVTALERVGVYVPGGKAAYPSSVLMTVIPAHVAQVKDITMVVPTPHGEINGAVMAAAQIAGVDRVITIGGAQAVAALAYGTESIKRVDKIVGPGNAYVASAKKQVFGVVDIDMIAGPSDIVVVCDQSANPHWVAMDLLAQAEHDELAQAIMITDSPKMFNAVKVALHQLLSDMPRKEIMTHSLNHQGALIQVSNLHQAIEVANTIAPEHLELIVENAQQYLDDVRNAGAIFLGAFSAEVFGDYCAGPNHVLPTSGTSRFSSPLAVDDFQKRSSILGVSKEGAKALAKIASTLAHAEGLTAHARSAELRLMCDDQ